MHITVCDDQSRDRKQITDILNNIAAALQMDFVIQEHPSKPLTMDQIKRNRRNIFILSILFTIVVLLCSLHSINAASTLTCSLMSIAVLTIHREHRSQSHS